ncbi:MAG: sugar ABC transporter permease [Saccharolobus sp.]
MKISDILEKEEIVGYLFLIPAFFFFTVIIGYPLFNGIIQSFYEKSLIYPISNFIGIKNYEELLKDSIFWNSLKNTLLWTLSITSTSLLVGLFLALILNQNLKGKEFFRATWLLPWALPTIVASLMWSWMYEPNIGVLNFILKKAGLIEEPVLWLTTPFHAFLSVLIVAIWKGFPFVMISLLAGLQSIPQELYESASIDGASFWEKFRYITIPSLLPVISIITTLQIIWNFNHFDIVYQMTRGGPGNATMLLSTLVYMQAFGATRLGYGSAIATVMLIFLCLFSYFYFSLYRKSWE